MADVALGENALGAYLKDRRAKLDPAALGYPPGRRRTPGLRREEVAQRANISATWYTWLEQGRGGGPSTEVLNRIAAALMLTEVEREHVFLLGLGHQPEARYEKEPGVSPRLQRVLDALEPSPALIRTATWDVVAWNRAVPIVLFDYEALPPEQRNILRSLFLDPRAKEVQYDWESVARHVLGAFRADVARAGASDAVRTIVDELTALSPEFRTLWRESHIPSHGGDGVKQIRHPVLGSITFEYSAFAVDGRTDLSMIVYNPVAAKDLDRIQALIDAGAAI